MLNYQNCDVCGTDKNLFEAFCPVSLLMGQKVKWIYCRSCYTADLKNAQIVKEKLTQDEINELIEKIRYDSANGHVDEMLNSKIEANNL